MKKLSVQMSLRLSEPGYESDPSDLECSIHREVFDIIAASISRVSRWGPPPNWAECLWAQEMEQVACLAALEADRDHCTYPDVELGAFIYQRVMSGLRDYSRREWRFGGHTARWATAGFESEPDESPLEEIPTPEPGPDQAAVERELDLLMMVLPVHQRSLVVRLYWLGLTETQEAKTSGVSQCIVNRRKLAALGELRNQFAINRITAAQLQPSIR